MTISKSTILIELLIKTKMFTFSKLWMIFPLKKDFSLKRKRKEKFPKFLLYKLLIRYIPVVSLKYILNTVNTYVNIHDCTYIHTISLSDTII